MEKKKTPEIDFFADLLETLEIDEVINVDSLLLSVYQYESDEFEPDQH